MHEGRGTSRGARARQEMGFLDFVFATGMICGVAALFIWIFH